MGKQTSNNKHKHVWCYDREIQRRTKQYAPLTSHLGIWKTQIAVCTTGFNFRKKLCIFLTGCSCIFVQCSDWTTITFLNRVNWLGYVMKSGCLLWGKNCIIRLLSILKKGTKTEGLLDHRAVSICDPTWTFEGPDRFPQKLVWKLCHWRHPPTVLFSFLHLLLTTQQVCKLWDGNNITAACFRMLK
jgi:hypothetical protein